MNNIVIDALRKAVELGYEAYEVVDGVWGFIGTPNGNVLYIQKADYGNGLYVSFVCKPSKICGSGCSCHLTRDEESYGISIDKLNKDTLVNLENRGQKFAMSLIRKGTRRRRPRYYTDRCVETESNKIFYKSVEEWKENYFFKEKLRKVGSIMDDMSREREKAYMAGGFRERYAMDNGTETEIEFGGDKCLRYTYSKDDAYQDGNGAIWDINRGKWIY